MTLNEKLQALKSASRSKIPAEKAAIMANATRQLEASGLIDNALKVGDLAPSFSLSDEQGHQYDSANLLAKGPLVLCFYRGPW